MDRLLDINKHGPQKIIVQASMRDNKRRPLPACSCLFDPFFHSLETGAKHLTDRFSPHANPAVITCS